MFIDVLKISPDITGNRVYMLDSLDKDKGETARLDGSVAISGNWSRSFPKKNYSIKLNKKERLFGIKDFTGGKSDSYVFKANFIDRTSIVNKLAYDLFREMGHYSSQSNHTLLYINNEYRGLYTLVQDKLDGLPINSSNEDPLLSGYAFMAARWETVKTPNTKFDSPLGRQIVLEKPGSSKRTAQHVEYLKNIVSNYENALKNNIIKEGGDDWRKYMDSQSEIDMMILTDLFFNVDSYIDAHNTLYFINKEGKIEASVWDLDMAFWSNGGGHPPYNADKPYLLWGAGLRYTINNPNFNVNRLTKYQMCDETHVMEFKKRYALLREGVLSTDNLVDKIQAWGKLLEESYKPDLVKTPTVWNPRSTVSELIKSVTNRLKFMDTDIPKVRPWLYKKSNGVFSYPETQVKAF